MKKILHIINWINVRGGEKACLNIVKNNEGYEHHFLAHSILDEEAKTDFAARGTIHILPEDAPLSFNYPDAPALINDLSIDLVHLYLPGDDLPAFILDVKIPIVLTILCTKKCNFNRIDTMRQVLVPSKYAKSLNKQLNPIVINYGVEKLDSIIDRETFCTHTLNISDGPNKVIVSRIGAIENIKRVDDFIILANSFAERDNIVFVLGGKCENEAYSAWLLSHVKTPNFIYLGFCSEQEKANLLSHTDIYLYPSEYEAFGISIVEAMSHSLPVLSYHNTAIPEILLSKSSSDPFSVCPPYRDLNLLRVSLSSFIDNQDLRKQVGNFNYKRWETFFKPKVYSDKVFAVYNEILCKQ